MSIFIYIYIYMYIYIHTYPDLPERAYLRLTCLRYLVYEDLLGTASLLKRSLSPRANGEEIALTTDFDNKDRIVQLASQARSGQMDWVEWEMWSDPWMYGLPVRTGR